MDFHEVSHGEAQPDDKGRETRLQESAFFSLAEIGVDGCIQQTEVRAVHKLERERYILCCSILPRESLGHRFIL